MCHIARRNVKQILVLCRSGRRRSSSTLQLLPSNTMDNLWEDYPSCFALRRSTDALRLEGKSVILKEWRSVFYSIAWRCHLKGHAIKNADTTLVHNTTSVRRQVLSPRSSAMQTCAFSPLCCAPGSPKAHLHIHQSPSKSSYQTLYILGPNRQSIGPAFLPILLPI